MTTKLGRLVTYNKELPFIKLYHLSLFTWQSKCFIYPHALDQWPPNMARWWLTVRGFHSKNDLIFETCGQARSRGKLQGYLHYYNASGFQTCQGGEVRQGARTHEFGKPLIDMFLLDHVINQIQFISTCRRPIVTKLGKVLTYR